MKEDTRQRTKSQVPKTDVKLALIGASKVGKSGMWSIKTIIAWSLKSNYDFNINDDKEIT